MKRILVAAFVLCVVQLSSGQEIYNRARALLGARDTSGAVTAFQDALKNSQKPAESNYYLGAIAFARSNYGDAQKYLEASVRINDENVDALKLLGDTYRNQKNVQEALNQYRRAIKLAPKNGPVTIAYGQALLAADSIDASIV